MSDRHLRLAGVTRLSLAGRGPRDAYVFDPHRLALGSWALALEDAGVTGPATLLTLDRHFDLAAPADPAAVPDRSAGFLALDAHARQALDVRNVDHILAACEAGLVGDVIALARSAPRGARAEASYTDRKGRVHRLERAASLERWLDGGGRLPEGPVLLDVDLDCFTTPSDADPQELVPWPRELIRAYLLPPGSERFWEEALARTVALTLAREPYHCGGLVAGGRLFEVAAGVLFGELLRADLP